MSFEGRTLREASHTYKESLNSLLAHTITRMPLIVVNDPKLDRTEIGFRHGGVTSATTLASRFGPIDLTLQQRLGSVEGQNDRVRLQVLAYRYAITPLGANDPLFRWEFVRFPSSGSFWCRHHLQGPINVDVSAGRSINLNDWHLPTGWVPIEEIIRFCIVDLSVMPLDTSVDADGDPGWHTRLSERVEDAAA